MGTPPLPPRPGRGATRNETPQRFNLKAREADGDWLDAREELDGDAPPLRTSVTVEKPRTIITRNQSPDVGFDRSINPTGDASMAASIASRGRRTPSTIFRPGSISNRACSPSPTPPGC